MTRTTAALSFVAGCTCVLLAYQQFGGAREQVVHAATLGEAAIRTAPLASAAAAAAAPPERWRHDTSPPPPSLSPPPPHSPPPPPPPRPSPQSSKQRSISTISTPRTWHICWKTGKGWEQDYIRQLLSEVPLGKQQFNGLDAAAAPCPVDDARYREDGLLLVMRNRQGSSEANADELDRMLAARHPQKQQQQKQQQAAAEAAAAT